MTAQTMDDLQKVEPFQTLHPKGLESKKPILKG